MPDTPTNRADLIVLFGDNVTGQISASDLRNFLVTALPSEFIGAYDFWNTPTSDNITTDLTTRGTHIYSQVISSNMSVSFGQICCLTSKGNWSTAMASTIANNNFLGVMADSYAMNATDAKVLLKGIVYCSALATRLSGYIGLPIYLYSGTSCSMSVTNVDNWSKVIGVVLPAGKNSVQTKGKYYFDPTWPVATGV